MNVLTPNKESGSRSKNGTLIKENIESIWTRNTDLCVDVKTFLLKDRVAQIGKEYQGILKKDLEDHYVFYEILRRCLGKRNPHVFRGDFLTVTRRDNGTLRLNFKSVDIDEGFVPESYALGVANEIVNGLKGLIEEGNDK